jgi:hypothetical protein
MNCRGGNYNITDGKFIPPNKPGFGIALLKNS